MYHYKVCALLDTILCRDERNSGCVDDIMMNPNDCVTIKSLSEYVMNEKLKTWKRTESVQVMFGREKLF